MLGNAKKVLATERMLQDLAQRDNTLDIPGNFRAQQRRQKHDDSRLVFPENRNKGKPKGEKHQTHYTLNFKQTSNKIVDPVSDHAHQPVEITLIHQKYELFFFNFGFIYTVKVME